MSDDPKVGPVFKVSSFLRSRIEAGDFPSAVYLIAEKGHAIFADALGDAVREPESRLANLDTIYDLASLTKPLITGMLCALLIERGEIDLDSRIADYLPEFDRADKQTITLRTLVTHTSGLPAWRPLYLLTNGTKEGALRAIAAEPLQSQPGERVAYSDLGFITLGFVLQRLSGQTLHTLAQKEIFEPLRLQQTFFNPALTARTGVAACENGNAYEREMCERDFAGRSYPGWRTETIWGEVHDGNAYFLGGFAGHAGLFSTVTDTLGMATQFIGSQTRLLKPQTCELFRRNLTEGLNEARSFAWQLASTRDSTAGPGLPPDAFGHTGFTGTSCWIDAEHERIFILLTNRTHNRLLPFANINSVRREFHTLAVDALTGR